MGKNLIINSGNEIMTINSLDTFRTVTISLKDTNLDEWNNFILDTKDMENIIKFFELQLKRSKRKRYGIGWNKQRTTGV